MEDTKLNLQAINKKIADRSNVFYWQTDRAITPAEAGEIWADRHRYFSDNEIIERANQELKDEKIVSLKPFNLSAQTNLGNVNSVRVAKLNSGKEVVIRCHPKGIENGYFHVEALASQMAKDAGLPGYSTLAIHDYSSTNDFAFHIIEKLPGIAIKNYLISHPQDEETLLIAIGRMMARLHKIKVKGFGPFDNEKAKKGELIGLHSSFSKAVRAGLAFNLKVLEKEGLFTSEQAKKIDQLFSEDNPLLKISSAVLVHNDFADWNLLTDGKDVTGILDWDESVAGDSVSDLACWSTFFNPARMDKFLEGYWQLAKKPSDFRDRFELLRLRYVISKMTLRIRRYGWEASDSVKERIESGKIHLRESMGYFGV